MTDVRTYLINPWPDGKGITIEIWAKRQHNARVYDMSNVEAETFAQFILEAIE